MHTVRSLVLVSSLSLATAAPALAMGRSPRPRTPVLEQARAIAMLFPFQAFEDAAHVLFPFWPGEPATPAPARAHETTAKRPHGRHHAHLAHRR